MGGASSFLAMLAIAGFLSAAWLATKISKLAGVSSIVLEITTGVVLGPRVLGLISDEYAVCEHQTHAKCVPPPDFLERLDNDLPVGATLGRIIGMDVCHREDYPHDALHKPEQPPHTTAQPPHTTAAESQATTAAKTTTTIPTTTTKHVKKPEPLWGGKSGQAVDDEAPIAYSSPTAGHDDDDGKAYAPARPAPASVPAEPVPDPPVEMESAPTLRDEGSAGGSGGGFDRRLGGAGHGSYHSYAECIEKTCESDVSMHCGHTPSIFTLIGHAGVALMIFESGMHFDFEKARIVGPKACVVAVVGTVLPLATGTLLTMLYGYPFLPDALSVGTALAPTSVGIALRLLGEVGVLQHDFGQAIITAAFVDDILSLVLFNILFSLTGDFDAMNTVVKPIIGIAFMGIAMVMAVKFWPRAILTYILPKLPKKSEDAKVSSDDEGLFLIMMGLLIGYGTITHFLGTHLWGCFIAGMSFACLDPPNHKGHTHHVWVRQTKRMTSWMIRIFFACTVAFSIPVQELLSFEAFWKGSIMGVIPCILTKVCCAPFMGTARWVIGWAMVGRAEFAYLIAQMAVSANMIDELTFSITIWALLYATIFAPFVFRTVLNRYIEAEGIETAAPTYMDSEEEEEKAVEDDLALVENRFDGASKPVGNDPEAANIIGKELEGLKKISPPKGEPEEREPLGYLQDSDLQAPTTEMDSGVTRRRVVKFWFGQAPERKVHNSNGFLCCFLFKKGILQQ